MPRDRSPLARRLPALLRVALALALVASPFWLLPHAGETAYAYEAAEIEYREGVVGFIRADGNIDRLPCYRFRDRTSPCLFAVHVAQNGPVTVNVSETLGGWSEPDSEYVAVDDSGSGRPFYRWQVNGTDDDDSDRTVGKTYALEAVGPETVLRDIAANESEVSPRVRRLVDGATVTVHGDPLGAAGQVVRSDGRYYLVTESRNDPDWTGGAATAVRVAFVVVGLALLRRTR